MDRDKARLLRAEILAALRPTEQKQHLQFKLGNITFDSNGFRVRLECRETVAENGEEVPSKEKADFLIYSKFEGLEGTFGKQFVFQGSVFKISGWKTKARRSRVLVTRIHDGKQFRMGSDTVKWALKGDKVGM